MGKYRRYKNRLEMFLSSERGKRVLNFLYSWGASEQGISLGRCFPRIEIKEPDGSSGFYRYADLNHDQFYG